MEEKRFKQIHFEEIRQYGSFKMTNAADYIEILKDTETGILYCVAKSHSGLTMTPLLDSEGKITIDKSE